MIMEYLKGSFKHPSIHHSQNLRICNFIIEETNITYEVSLDCQNLKGFNFKYFLTVCSTGSPKTNPYL